MSFQECSKITIKPSADSREKEITHEAKMAHDIGFSCTKRLEVNNCVVCKRVTSQDQTQEQTQKKCLLKHVANLLDVLRWVLSIGQVRGNLNFHKRRNVQTF